MAINSPVPDFAKNGALFASVPSSRNVMSPMVPVEVLVESEMLMGAIRYVFPTV